MSVGKKSLHFGWLLVTSFREMCERRRTTRQFKTIESEVTLELSEMRNYVILFFLICILIPLPSRQAGVEISKQASNREVQFSHALQLFSNSSCIDESSIVLFLPFICSGIHSFAKRKHKTWSILFRRECSGQKGAGSTCCPKCCAPAQYTFHGPEDPSMRNLCTTVRNQSGRDYAGEAESWKKLICSLIIGNLSFSRLLSFVFGLNKLLQAPRSVLHIQIESKRDFTFAEFISSSFLSISRFWRDSKNKKRAFNLVWLSISLTRGDLQLSEHYSSTSTNVASLVPSSARPELS